MADRFASSTDTVTACARRTGAVTPHNTNALTDIPKALYVGTAGHVIIRAVDDTTDQTWKNVPAGAVLPVRAQYVRATGTTAADILALY